MGDAQPGYDLPVVFEVRVSYRGVWRRRQVEALSTGRATWASDRAVASIIKRAKNPQRVTRQNIARVRAGAKIREISDGEVQRRGGNFIALRHA